jgi:ABC-type multidrug transport system fused ATPase/permease subunit
MQESLRPYIHGRTTVIISHRLSTVLDIDQIVVIEHGNISDIGSHWQLQTRNAFYASVASAQAAIAR